MTDALTTVIPVPRITEEMKQKALAAVKRQPDATLLLKIIGLEES